MRSITTLDLQYAHRFYGFKGEAQYLHGHTGVLTIEVEDTINEGCDGPESYLEPVTSWSHRERLAGHRVTGLSKLTTVETLKTSLAGGGALYRIGRVRPMRASPTGECKRR